MRKVIGTGETVLDIILKNNKSAEAVPGGPAFNAIMSLGRCRVNTSFISGAGDGHVGKYIIDFLKDSGVSADNVSTFSDSRLPVSLASLNEKNGTEYIFHKDHPHVQLDLTFPDTQPDDIVLSSSFYTVNPVIHPQVVGLLDYAHSRGTVAYYDVNFHPAHKDDVTKITPNLIENLDYAGIIRGSLEDFATIHKKEDADKVYSVEISFYYKQFIYTQGSQPVEVRSDKESKRSCPVFDMNVVSTIGAGDNFNVGFIFGMLKHDITRADFERGLTGEQWDKFINYVLAFPTSCYRNTLNYVSKDLGEKMKGEAL